jgi:WD40 repeat protein
VLTFFHSSRVVSSKLPNRLSHRIQAHKESIISIACSNDGKWIATGSSDHTVRLWDVKTGR